MEENAHVHLQSTVILRMASFQSTPHFQVCSTRNNFTITGFTFGQSFRMRLLSPKTCFQTLQFRDMVKKGEEYFAKRAIRDFHPLDPESSVRTELNFNTPGNHILLRRVVGLQGLQSVRLFSSRTVYRTPRTTNRSYCFFFSFFHIGWLLPTMGSSQQGTCCGAHRRTGK